MRLDLSTGPVKFFFTHSKENKKRITTCTVASEVGGGCVIGEARCSPKDKFVKAEGRKRSFMRMIETAGFSRADRTILWNAYLYRGQNLAAN